MVNHHRFIAINECVWITSLNSDAQLLAGQRFIKLAKSPISPPLAFPFNITASGIVLLDDNGIEMKGPEINNIHCQGLSLRFWLLGLLNVF
jgi:hypothetical protein